MKRALGMCLIAVGMLTGCHEEKSSTLTVGMELSYPPFEMTDQQGRPSGVSVDLAEAMGRELNRPVKIENYAFDGLIPALRGGQIDCIISSMTATPERAKSVDFSDPYVTTGLGVLLPKVSVLASVDELNRPGVTIAVKKGTTGYLYAVDHLPLAKLLILDKENSAVLEVVEHKADAFIYDQMSIYQQWQKNLATTQALLRPIQRESWAIAVAPGHPDLLRQINSFLAHYREQGGFRDLSRKYLAEQMAAFEKMGVPFIF